MSWLKAESRRLKTRSAFSLQLLALLVAACSHPAPEAPAPAPPPVVMEPASPPPATGMVTPSAAAGTWRLRTVIESGNTPPPSTGRAPTSQIVLTAQAATTAAMGAPAGAHFNARVAMPGYSARAPRGQTGQAATWWPIPGDSVVVQFSRGSRGEMQLRGRLQAGAMQGEIWYLSLESGSQLQLGTFSANKQR